MHPSQSETQLQIILQSMQASSSLGDNALIATLHTLKASMAMPKYVTTDQQHLSNHCSPFAVQEFTDTAV